MKDVTPFELERLFYGFPPNLYYLEIFIRILAVFVILLFVLRLIGKRGQRSITPMQNILIISLGTAVGDAMILPSIPLFYSFGVFIIVPGLMTLLNFTKLKSDAVNRVLTADCTVLVKNGKLNQDAMNANRLRKENLYAMLRTKDIEFVEQVRIAIFETNGDLSVFKNAEGSYKKSTSLLSEFDM